MIGNHRLLNDRGPTDDHRHTHPAFVKRALHTPETGTAVEKSRIIPAFLMRTVIAGEHHQGVPVNPVCLQTVEHLADIPVDPTDHRSIGCLGIGIRLIACPLPIRHRLWLFIKELFISLIGTVARRHL